MDIVLKVTPEELLASSSEFASINSQVTTTTNNMLEKIRSVSSWIGDAHTSYVNKFNTLEEDMSKIRRMIEEHSNDLSKIAQEFIRVEGKNVDTGSALSGNVC